MRRPYAAVTLSALAASPLLGCPSLDDIHLGGPGAGVDAAPDRARDVVAADAPDRDACGPAPATDPRNCGRCRHDCGRGACKGGVCQPYSLASGLLRPWGVAVSAKVIYFTTEVLNIERCNVDDCQPAQFASVQQSPHAITTNLTNVFWADEGITVEGGLANGAIVTCGLDGCTGGAPTVLSSHELAPFDLVVDTNNVYWTEVNGHAVRSCSVIGCGGSPKTIATDPALLSGIAVDPAHVYWAEPDLGNVIQCPLDGCPSFAPFATGQTGAAELDVAAADVYWSANGAIMSCPTAGCGGAPRAFAKNQRSSYAITHDSENLYWTLLATDGKVLSCPLSGCATPTVLAEGQDMPSSVAVDRTSVYWANSGSGEVMRVMK